MFTGNAIGMLGDATESCAEMKTFFAIVQSVYVFFGSSAPEWALLKAFSSDQKTNISLKSLCTTRWESRYSSVTVTITRILDLVKNLTHLILTGDWRLYEMKQQIS